MGGRALQISLAPVVATGVKTSGMRSQAKNLARVATAEIGQTRVMRVQPILTAAGLLAGLAGSACCVLPLALFALGISGTWIGNLTQLAPFQPFSSRQPLPASAAGIGWSTGRDASAA